MLVHGKMLTHRARVGLYSICVPANTQTKSLQAPFSAIMSECMLLHFEWFPTPSYTSYGSLLLLRSMPSLKEWCTHCIYKVSFTSPVLHRASFSSPTQLESTCPGWLFWFWWSGFPAASCHRQKYLIGWLGTCSYSWFSCLQMLL